MVGGPLDHLLQDGSVHIGQWHHLLVLENIELQNLTNKLPDSHLLVHAEVLEHGLDGHGLLGDLHVHREDLAIARLQLDRRHLEPGDLSLQGGRSLITLTSQYELILKLKKTRRQFHSLSDNQTEKISTKRENSQWIIDGKDNIQGRFDLRRSS